MECFLKQHSMYYKPIQHNINHHHLKNDVDIQLTVALHTLNELNPLHKEFENFYKKNSSPVHNNSNKRHNSTLPASIYQCYETSIDSRMKPDFRSLHLHPFQPNKRKRSREISLSRDSMEKDPDCQEIPEGLLFNLPSIRL